MQIRNYLKKLSGPLLDRIDIRAFVEAPTRVEMAAAELGESSEDVKKRVMEARTVAAERFKDERWCINSQIPSSELRARFKAQRDGMTLLHNELDSERLSARGFHKVLRVAWSIADGAGHSRPTKDDVEQAIVMREGTFL